MIQLIDSHCHLTFSELHDQIVGVLERAAAAGVGEIITVAADLDDAHRALALAAEYPAVHVAAGIHPHEAAKMQPGWHEALMAVACRGDVRAVGEIGLDYHYDFSDRQSQHRVFRRQLEIAATVGKPVVIHCREAHDDVMDALRGFPGLTGVVFHCFSGTLPQAEEILARGYWLSFTGVITFRKSDELRRVAKRVPADRLMIETDAPYLSPEPVRNVRPNEPAMLIHTATCLASQRGMETAELCSLATDNTRRFFSLPAR